MKKIKLFVASLAPLGVVVVMASAGVGSVAAAPPNAASSTPGDYAIATVVPAPPGAVPAHSRQEIQDAAYARCLASSRVPAIPTKADSQSVEGKASLRAGATFQQRVPPSFDDEFGGGGKQPNLLEPVVAAPIAPNNASPVSAFADEPPVPGRSAQAIADAFDVGNAAGSSRGSTPASCSPIRFRFWRGLMTPAVAGC